MLSLRALPRYINRYLKQSQLHTCANLMTVEDSQSSSSSSSSSDSSDSDSDKEEDINKKQTAKLQKQDEDLSPAKMNERLNNLLLKISEVSKIQEPSKFNLLKKNTTKESPSKLSLTPGIIDVSIKHRRDRFKKIETQKKKEPIENQIVGAAKDLAKSIGDESGKTEAELLGQILNLKSIKPEEEQTTKTSKKTPTYKPSLSELLSSMKIDKPSTTLETHKKEMAMKVKYHLNEKSVSMSLLKKQTISKTKVAADIPELNIPQVGLNIFKTLPEEEPENIPSLSTWEAMEKREIKLAILTTPQNIFQELIQWTDQGKLWHFPINNEQGMEEEEKVHFSEHVFLERHLKGWCPKKGPVRHFMELVCVGLSKNPYLTVQDKIGHIKWYKNYFEDKKDILIEVGALDPSESRTETQIAA